MLEALQDIQAAIVHFLADLHKQGRGLDEACEEAATYYGRFVVFGHASDKIASLALSEVILWQLRRCIVDAVENAQHRSVVTMADQPWFHNLTAERRLYGRRS